MFDRRAFFKQVGIRIALVLAGLVVVGLAVYGLICVIRGG